MVLRVAEGRALEFQHLTPRIIERINAYYGYEAIGALKILQGTVAAPSRAVPEPAPEVASQDIGKRVEAIGDEGLREALLRLGTAISHREAASSKSITPTRMSP